MNQYRRELHVHCYRMTGSFEEAEDLVQETFLRAWRRRDSFDGANERAWLYRIATNACLDALKTQQRRPATEAVPSEVPWLQPYPDALLDEAAETTVIARETIELAFLTVIQALPPLQRAVLLLRDVIELSAQETADVLDTTPAAVNSALQRARATIGDRPEPAAPSPDERRLLEGFIATHESGDIDAAVALIADDIRVTMPPNPWVYEGIANIVELMTRAHDGSMGEWRLVPFALNRQPAAASYQRAPGETEFRAFKFDVLRVRGDRIAEITTFGPELFAAFGLPLTA